MPRIRHPEPPPTVKASPRDYVMARIAAARSTAQTAIDAMDETIAMFTCPEEDKNGRKRGEAIAVALEQLGCATRAMECAEAAIDDADPSEPEPWEDDDGET